MASHPTSQRPTALLESFSGGAFAHSFRFDGLENTIVAYVPDQVLPALQTVERAVVGGMHAVGFVGYEAANAINSELTVHDSGDLPLVWFSIFRERHAITPDTQLDETTECHITVPELDSDQSSYTAAITRIRNAIARGDTYQVNYTVRQHFQLSGDPFALYRRMCRNQQAPFCAWLDTGSHTILSASPELFFSLDNELLTMKPMKGTAPRAPRSADDRQQRTQLARSPKDQAENLMIVDLVRNDLATIAETGSVEVPRLFQVETYPTVHQMTSTVTGRIRPLIGLTDIFRALFPCGSVTGAPKRRTMEIIAELEQSPRGVYCGAIGYVSPGREAVFSVAIRTAVVESATGRGQMGIGSGITWGSDPAAEFQECLDKGAFLLRDSRPFQLIESLRHDKQGYLLLERHLARLAESAHYFGFRCDLTQITRQLTGFGQGLTGIHKVRLLLAQDGSTTLDATEITDPTPDAPPLQVAISRQPVDSRNPFLYHKTTRRSLYEQELQAHAQCGEVLFLNQRGEVTEGSYTNVVISRNDRLLTPALACGLLPGVLREELLEVGAIEEAILTRDDLLTADTVWLINSVRGWRECRLMP